jgi:hypothetical protein
VRASPTLFLLFCGLAGLYACGQPKQTAMKPAPETEIVLLYGGDERGEFEECG